MALSFNSIDKSIDTGKEEKKAWKEFLVIKFNIRSTMPETIGLGAI